MQFFPHIGSSGFPPPPSTPGVLADRQPDENFASLLSSQLDRQDTSATEKDAPARPLDEADAGAEASSPKAPRPSELPAGDDIREKVFSWKKEPPKNDAKPESPSHMRTVDQEKPAVWKGANPGKEAGRAETQTLNSYDVKDVIKGLDDVLSKLQSLMETSTPSSGHKIPYRMEPSSDQGPRPEVSKHKRNAAEELTRREGKETALAGIQKLDSYGVKGVIRGLDDVLRELQSLMEASTPSSGHKIPYRMEPSSDQGPRPEVSRHRRNEAEELIRRERKEAVRADIQKLDSHDVKGVIRGLDDVLRELQSLMEASTPSSGRKIPYRMEPSSDQGPRPEVSRHRRNEAEELTRREGKETPLADIQKLDSYGVKGVIRGLGDVLRELQSLVEASTPSSGHKIPYRMEPSSDQGPRPEVSRHRRNEAEELTRREGKEPPLADIQKLDSHDAKDIIQRLDDVLRELQSLMEASAPSNEHKIPYRMEPSSGREPRPEVSRHRRNEAEELTRREGKETPLADIRKLDSYDVRGVIRGLDDVLRELRVLLESSGTGQVDGQGESEDRNEKLGDIPRRLQKFFGSIQQEGNRKGVLDETGHLESGQMDAEHIWDSLQSLENRASDGAVRDTAESKALRKDARQIIPELFGEGRDIRLSMRDREALQEVLARMENMKERLVRMGRAEPARTIRPVGRRDAGIDANAPAPGKVAQGPHPSVSVRKKMDPAALEPDSAAETVRAAAMTSPDAARTVRVGMRNESAESREVSTGQHVEREARSNGTSVVPEPDSAGQERPGGNFFREPGQSGQPGKESPNPAEGTRINVSPRSLESGEYLTVKNPDVEGIFMPQTPAAARPEAASATAMKARGAEVLRQVEAGAFRDLGQGNKQLVIRLDPPDLGQVSVVLQVRGKEVQAVLRTGNQETSQVLADQLGQLRNQLESQGLRVTRLEVQTQLADSQTGSQWQGAEQHNRYQENRELAMTAQRLRTLGRAEPVLARDMQNLPHKENISSGGVDVFA